MIYDDDAFINDKTGLTVDVPGAAEHFLHMPIMPAQNTATSAFIGEGIQFVFNRAVDFTTSINGTPLKLTGLLRWRNVKSGAGPLRRKYDSRKVSAAP